MADELEPVRRWLTRAAHLRPGLPAPQVLLRAPGLELRWGDLDRPFHVASVGKLFTGALVGMLLDAGRFGLGTPIGQLLPPADVVGLPTVGGADPGRIKVGHLLTHTAGLPDYFDPPRGHTTRCSRARFTTDPDHRWTPAELLDETRGLPAVALPGQRFAYTDTAFVLLGRIVEEAWGTSFPDALRERITDPLGLTRTSMPHHELSPAELARLDIAPLVVAGKEVSRLACTSVDWAGGGVVSTADELVTFQRALRGGELVSPDLLRAYARPLHRFLWGMEYGMGTSILHLSRFAPLYPGLPRPVGHIGVTATHLFHDAPHDAHVVLNFHSTRAMVASMQCHVHLGRVLARRP